MAKTITTPSRGNWQPASLKNIANSKKSGMGIDRKENPNDGFSGQVRWQSTDAAGKMTSIVRQTLGIIPDDTGKKQVASRSIQREAERGRRAAESFVMRTAKAAATSAEKIYADLKFPKIRVRAEKAGAGVRLAIYGDSNSVKMARILESGASNPVMMHSFINGAKKKRMIKITRQIKLKDGTVRTAPRGKAVSPGFYMVIPVTLGTVKRGENGKLQVVDERSEKQQKTYEERDGKGEVGLRERALVGMMTYEKYGTLEAFTATPDGAGSHVTDEDNPKAKFMSRTGDVRFSKGEDGNWKSKPVVRSGSNEPWEVPKYTKGDGGVSHPGTVDDEGNHSRYASNTDRSRGNQSRASQKGTKMLNAMGKIDNLTINDPDVVSSPEPTSPGIEARFIKAKGKAVTFIVISTNQPDRVLHKGRKAEKVLGKVFEEMRGKLAVRERNLRLELQKDYADHTYEKAYLEVILAAMRSPQ